MNTGRIIVCGGRNYSDFDRVNRVLDGLLYKQPIQRVFFPYELQPPTFAWDFRTLVHGKASGADSLAASWADFRGVSSETHPAQWDRWGNSAGPRRNEEMARTGADLLVAFPGGTGTDNMITNARFFRIPVMKVAA